MNQENGENGAAVPEPIQKQPNRAFAFVQALIRRLPIVSGFADCNTQNHREACKEFAVNLVLSTSPLWLGSLIVFSLDPRAENTLASYGRFLLGSMSDGELLIYATAAITPLFYFSLTPAISKDRDYPSRLSHIVSGLLIFMICSALFGAQRAGGKMQPTLIFPMSVCLYLFALVIIYIATVYRNYRDYREAVGEQYAASFDPGQSEEEFLKRVRKHRGE